MKRIIYSLFVLSALVVSSCTTPKTLSQQYPKMYEEKPLTIAIMPPINQTTHAEAKDFFYTTMYMPLCEKGYYVYSPYLTMEMFQQESAYDAEMFLEADLTPFRNVLGTDAAMFTIIKNWQRVNISGKLTVQIEYVLRSTKTGETLYNREGQITVDTSINSGVGGFGALVDLVATAVNTAMTDKVVAGRKCNVFVLSDMPAGKYSPLYEQDMNNPAGKKFIKAVVK
ncbi:GNA1162 family protein [uncultured Bacteroides sp.]|uniref:GNA1162 family protein n=1 Tax=uncultured Bacteroides sp. TaxID=162156 RepID=UPI002635D28B|nr:GNA1162 family protein [uncultured Bacteroides sp.]